MIAATPVFKYESSTKLYNLRKASYDADFTSKDWALCFDVLWAISHNTERPKYQRSNDPREDAALLREWNRAMEIATSSQSAINSTQ